MGKNIIVTGSSGFIGGHLVRKLMGQGHHVIGVDMEEPQYSSPDEFIWMDLRYDIPIRFKRDIHEVYNLACLMGGMGYIGDSKHDYDIMIGSTQIIANVLDMAREMANKPKMFYSSSACVYNQDLQTSVYSGALHERDAYPANPDLVYGWQKIMGEKMYEASGMDIRIARFHNIFGPEGTWNGGKEKAPAALCRKVAEAKDGDEIEVWGNGLQRRSFLYIDECLEGVERLMNSCYTKPLNIGSSQSVSINDLADIIIGISGKNLAIKNIKGNVGVTGRNSDNTLIKEELGWAPVKDIRKGLQSTYSWINKQVNG